MTGSASSMAGFWNILVWLVCPSLCVGKKDKKEIKTLGSPPGDL
jgi:hypothetical protein